MLCNGFVNCHSSLQIVTKLKADEVKIPQRGNWPFYYQNLSFIRSFLHEVQVVDVGGGRGVA